MKSSTYLKDLESMNYYKIFSKVSLGFISLLFSCSIDRSVDEISQSDDAVNQLVLYIVDDEHETSTLYNREMAKVFDYVKIPYKSCSIEDYNDNFDSYNPKVIFISNTSKLNASATNQLLKFTAEGGTLVFPSVNEDQKMGFLSGLKPDAEFDYDLISTGIHLKEDIIPSTKGLSIYPHKKNVGFLGSNFKKSIRVLATSSSDHNQPIIILNEVGNGKVIHFNTGILFEKQDRGLLFASALQGLDNVPYPIANASAIFLDDFPSPIYDIQKEPIKSELGISYSNFVIKTWWPDMLKVAEKFNLTYSAYLVYSYDVVTSPPFPYIEWDSHSFTLGKEKRNGPVWLSQQVLQQGHELGLHGYNHQSLMKSVWNNMDNIDLAFGTLRKKWILNRLGSFPKTYVAPSNEIDSVGLSHLNRSMPEIKFMSTTYDGEIETGGGREFDTDPYTPKLFDYPRISSGYYFTDPKLYNIHSMYLFTGIWTHFIHPDDVFQLPAEDNLSAGKYDYRNGEKLGWYNSANNNPGMLETWTKQLESMQSIYPSIRYKKVTDAAMITQEWRSTIYKYEEDGEFYSVTKSNKNKRIDDKYHWFLFAKETNSNKIEGYLKRISPSVSKTKVFDGFLFTIETLTPNLIMDKNIKVKKAPKFFEKEVVPMVMEEFTDFENDRADADDYEEEYAGEENNVQETEVSEVDEEEAIMNSNAFVQRLRQAEIFDSIAFNEYKTYLSNQESDSSFWSMLEDIYTQSEPLSFQYLDNYLTISTYPNEALNQLWLERKITHDPSDKVSIQEYLDIFYENRNSRVIERMLITLNEVNPSDEHYALYIQYLLDFKPELLTKELEDKDPKNHPLLQSRASAITYAFAEEGKLQEALLWSEYSTAFTVMDKLQWWADLKAYNKMQSVYDENQKTNPNDTAATAFVSNTWYDMGEYERGALIASTLPKSKQKTDFTTRLNSDIRFFDTDKQKYLIIETPELIRADTLTKIKTNLRLKEHNWVELNSSYVVDNFNQSILENTGSFHLRTNQLNQHSFSAIHSEVSDLVLQEVDVNNISHSLLGLRYRYQNNVNTTKLHYWGGLGFDHSNNDQFYYNLRAGLSKSDSIAFKSLQFTHEPVKTGPALSREVYKSEITGYYERGYSRFFQPSASLVYSNYTTNATELAFTGRAYFNLERTRKSRLSPFGEALLSTSNSNQENGNPFWIIDNRFYGGGGVAWTYGTNPAKFNSRLEAGIFYDSYTDYFFRVLGNASYPINEYTYLVGQFELFNQALYYSNGFQLGLRHYLKRKRPYTYLKREY